MTDADGHQGGPRSAMGIPGDRVVSEVIDGEVVAIDLQSGRYYSLEGAAARAWEAIQAGGDMHAVTAAVATEAGIDADEARPDVAAFLAELHEEGLVHGGNAVAPSAASPGRVSLVLNRYTDMQDLIVLDPIHDVDETGWPNRSPG